MPPTTDPAAPVWWVAPASDRFQHAVLVRPPRDGGPVVALDGQLIDAPAHADVPPDEFRPYCPACLWAYLDSPTAEPRWTY